MTIGYAYKGGDCFTLYVRAARWQIRGLVLKRELARHAANCPCKCRLCGDLRELAGEENPRTEHLHRRLRTINLASPPEGESNG